MVCCQVGGRGVKATVTLIRTVVYYKYIDVNLECKSINGLIFNLLYACRTSPARHPLRSWSRDGHMTPLEALSVLPVVPVMVPYPSNLPPQLLFC